MPSLRQELEKINTRIPITQFTYDPDTRKFRYRPTGQVWKRAGVDAVVGRVEGMNPYKELFAADTHFRTLEEAAF